MGLLNQATPPHVPHVGAGLPQDPTSSEHLTVLPRGPESSEAHGRLVGLRGVETEER